MTWAEILDLSAASLNDQAQEKFTDVVLLPYLNMARMELEEVFEQNDIPVSEETSTILSVPANSTFIDFFSSPALPSDLIEIKQLWESTTGQNQFVPVTKVDSLTGHITGGSTYTSFGVWAWQNQQVKVRGAVGIVDVKIDYVRAFFATPITISLINQQNDVRNSSSFYIGRRLLLPLNLLMKM
jgi:hypothetical protein